jgi:hypothetical protein
VDRDQLFPNSGVALERAFPTTSHLAAIALHPHTPSLQLESVIIVVKCITPLRHGMGQAEMASSMGDRYGAITMPSDQDYLRCAIQDSRIVLYKFQRA